MKKDHFGFISENAIEEEVLDELYRLQRERDQYKNALELIESELHYNGYTSRVGKILKDTHLEFVH